MNTVKEQLMQTTLAQKIDIGIDESDRLSIVVGLEHVLAVTFSGHETIVHTARTAFAAAETADDKSTADLLTSTRSRNDSPLDHPPVRFAHHPFYAETLTLLRNVRDHDFESLQWLRDDDFGIVDVDPTGRARVIRSTAEWIQWFHELFSTFDAAGADTDSEIISYKAVREQSLGYSVVEFRQSLTVGEHTALFDCIATIVWKQSNSGWREARWHGLVISSKITDELRELSERAA